METKETIIVTEKEDITKETVIIEIEGSTNQQYTDSKEKPCEKSEEIELESVKNDKKKVKEVKPMSKYKETRMRCSDWCDQNCGPGEIDYDIPVIMTDREKELRKSLPKATIEPMTLVCPRCEKEITTSMVDSSGLASCLVCILICLVGGWCCCIIPFYIKCLLNKNHFCPHCDAFIAQYRRLNCA